MKSLYSRIGAIIVVGLSLVVSVARADNNWDGESGSSANWSDGVNWFGNSSPGPGGGVDINFNFQVTQWDSNYDYGNYDDFHSIIFNTSLAHYLHLNNPLTRGMDLFGSIVNNNFNGVDFNVDVAFNAADPHIEANNSQLVFNNGNIYLNGNTVHFLSSGSQTIYVNGAIQNGSGSGAVQLGSSFMNVHFNNSGNAYTGQTSIDFGTLINDTDNVIPDVSDLFVGSTGVYGKNGKSETVNSIFGSGTIKLGTTGNLIYNGNASQTYSGTFESSASLVKKGTGTWQLSGNSTLFSGDIYEVGGTLQLSNNGAAGTSGTVHLGETGGSDAATLSIDSGVTIARPVDVRTGSSGIKTITGAGTLSGGVSIADLTPARVVFDVGTGNTLTIGTTGISGAGAGFTKTGAGTLLLASGTTSTYSGPTTINGGVLRVNGSVAGNGAFTVNSGGTLAGSGSITNSTVFLSGVISPGNSPGTLATGSQTWTNGASYVFEVNDFAGTAGADPGWDKDAITGTLDLTGLSVGGFTVNMFTLTLANAAGLAVNWNNALPYTLTFVTTTGGINGFAANQFIVDTNIANFQNTLNGTWSVGLNGNNLELNYAPFSASGVPEPGTLGLLAAGAALVYARRRVKKI